MKNKDNAIISSKIELLFEGRRLFKQCEHMIPEKMDNFLSSLRDLQLSIYFLDKYFEKTWYVNPNDLKYYWSEIFLSLNKIVPQKENLEYLVRDIRAYQRLEEGIRNLKDFSFINLPQVYHLKTCDVRLARQLIARSANWSLREKHEYLQSWELYDLVSEVCDDLDDLNEDLKTFNGNWILLNISTIGLDTTISAYQNFGYFLSTRIEEWKSKLTSKRSAIPLVWARENLIHLHEKLNFYSSQKNIIAEICANSAVVTAHKSSICPRGIKTTIWLQRKNTYSLNSQVVF